MLVVCVMPQLQNMFVKMTDWSQSRWTEHAHQDHILLNQLFLSNIKLTIQLLCDVSQN